jgi:lysozyme family protein
MRVAVSVQSIDEMLADLLKNEGGYVNNPNDPGGETNYGVTVKVARAKRLPGRHADHDASRRARHLPLAVFPRAQV